MFDGAGLALFAVTGTEKALAAGLNPVMAALMGMLTGIGGGMLRDVLVNQTPTVLRADLYAVAALAAGVVVVAGHFMHYPSFAVMIVGALLCFWLRVMAILRGWYRRLLAHLLDQTNKATVREAALQFCPRSFCRNQALWRILAR